MVAALGSQLVLVVGSDSSCQLWELSFVPLHWKQTGRCHPAGMLGCFTFRVMAVFLGPFTGEGASLLPLFLPGTNSDLCGHTWQCCSPGQ